MPLILMTMTRIELKGLISDKPGGNIAFKKTRRIGYGGVQQEWLTTHMMVGQKMGFSNHTVTR